MPKRKTYTAAAASGTKRVRLKGPYAKKKKFRKKAGVSLVKFRNAVPPPHAFKRFVYHDTQQWAPALTADVLQWRGNSLYDPDYTGAGHQPLYFDQTVNASVSGFYTKAEVLFYRLTVELVNTSAASNEVLLLPFSETAVEADSLGEITAYPGIRRALLAPSGSGKSSVKLDSGLVDVRKHLASAADDELSHTASTNPSKPAFCTLMAWEPKSVTNLDLTVRVQIVFYAKCSELQPLTS